MLQKMFRLQNHKQAYKEQSAENIKDSVLIFYIVFAFRGAVVAVIVW